MYFGKSQIWQILGRYFRTYHLSWFSAWLPETSRTRLYPTHLSRRLNKEIVTIDELLYLISGFREPKCNEGIFKFLDSNGTISLFVKGVKVLSEFFEGMLGKVDKMFFAMCFEPASFAEGTDIGLIGRGWELLIQVNGSEFNLSRDGGLIHE